jgi:hypothetical protein
MEEKRIFDLVLVKFGRFLVNCGNILVKSGRFLVFFGIDVAKWHARAFSSLNRSPAGLKIQYRRTGDSLCSVQFCNYFETFQCMLIF